MCRIGILVYRCINNSGNHSNSYSPSRQAPPRDRIPNNNIVLWSRRRCRGESVGGACAPETACETCGIFAGAGEAKKTSRQEENRPPSWFPTSLPPVHSCGILLGVAIGETVNRERDGTEDIYLYTDSVGPRRSLHEPTRSSDDGKSCSGRRAPDVPVAGH